MDGKSSRQRVGVLTMGPLVPVHTEATRVGLDECLNMCVWGLGGGVHCSGGTLSLENSLFYNKQEISRLNVREGM